MMAIQKIEASSLCAMQTRTTGKEAPELVVSFPFPEVFTQARNIALKYLLENSES